MTKTYVLVLFDEGKPKGVAWAMKMVLEEDEVKKVLGESNATIIGTKDGVKVKYTISQKRLFEITNLDGSVTLFIIADASRQK